MVTTQFDPALLDMSDREQKLMDAKQTIAGEIPLIENPPSCMLHLVRGLSRGADWQQEAEVRELTGADEESLARVRDAVDFFDLVLALGTVRIGSVDLASHPPAERQIILQELLIGERSQMLLEIIKVTYGDKKVLNINCPVCSAEQEVDLILSEDFKAKKMDEPHKIIHTFVTSRGFAVEYRLVTGADQNTALARKGASTAEQNSIILSKVITAVNGGLVPDPLGFARELPSRDRAAILKSLLDLQPDIDLSLKVPCAGCGGEQSVSLGWQDLFRP